MANNSTHDPKFDPNTAGGNEYVPARVMYERAQGQPRMVDDCDGHAIFQSTVLEANGWDAYMIGLSIEGPIGHNTAGVNLSDGRILVIDDAGIIEGYFDSLASVARHYIQKGWMTDGGTLKIIRGSQITRVTTDYTSPNVLGLPWTSHEY